MLIWGHDIDDISLELNVSKDNIIKFLNDLYSIYFVN